MCETPMGSENDSEGGDRPGGADELVHVFANPVRRDVLREFAATPTEMTLEELARIVASKRAGRAESTRTVALILHHVHLPKLEAAGLLTYDQESRRVDPDGVAGSHVWQTVTAMDGVVTLAENDARPTADADERLSTS